MAQRTRTRLQELHLLTRRFGLAGKAPVAVTCVVLAVFIGFAGMFVVSNQRGVTVDRSAESSATQIEKVTATQELETTSTPPHIVVHIDGAVMSPGVYTLEVDQPRINDVVCMAGGLSPEADTTSINLASVVTDGSKVHIPTWDEAANTPESPPSATESGTSIEPADDRVDINMASASELQTLPGVGEATAAAIIEDRERNGPFATPEDLMRVSGIGEKKFAKLQDKIRVS